MTERREEGREREGERDQAERDTQRENVMIICKTNTFCQPRKKKPRRKGTPSTLILDFKPSDSEKK